MQKKVSSGNGCQGGEKDVERVERVGQVESRQGQIQHAGSAESRGQRSSLFRVTSLGIALENTMTSLNVPDTDTADIWRAFDACMEEGLRAMHASLPRAPSEQKKRRRRVNGFQSSSSANGASNREDGSDGSGPAVVVKGNSRLFNAIDGSLSTVVDQAKISFCDTTDTGGKAAGGKGGRVVKVQSRLIKIMVQ